MSSTTAPPSVAVLGASGYIGSVVTGMLAHRPLRLRAVSRRGTSPGAGGAAEVEGLAIDLTEPGALARAVAGVDVVLHLMKFAGDWRAPERQLDAGEAVNVGVVRALVEELRRRPVSDRPPLVVLAGACSQAGPATDGPLDGTQPDRPDTEYDRQKLAAETLLLDATRTGAVRGVSLRLGTVFGQSTLGDTPDPGVVTAMVRRALAGRPLALWHDGSVVRDIVDVEDAGEAFLAAIDRPHALVGRCATIGTGRSRRLDDVFDAVATAVAAETGLPAVPVVSTAPPDTAVATDFRDIRIDPAPFAAATGWVARRPMHESLTRTIRLLRASAAGDRDPAASDR